MNNSFIITLVSLLQYIYPQILIARLIFLLLSMSAESLRFRSVSRQKSHSKSVSLGKKMQRRYSDTNILLLEGHKKVSLEEEKGKLIRKKEELLLIFKRKFILDEHGQLLPGMVERKETDGSTYIGELNSDGKREGKGILYCINGDRYFG